MVKEAFKKQTYLNYNLTLGTNKNISEKYPEKTKDLFKYLFDESIDLQKRIQVFGERADNLRKQVDPKLNGFQDERAISVYLTFKYPDLYTFYKYSYYSKYCRMQRTFMSLKIRCKLFILNQNNLKT